MPEIAVVFDPAQLPTEYLAKRTAVVIDVLRATTSMLSALAAGAARIVPTLEVAEAVALRDRLPGGTAVLAGERGGLQIDGFDLGNSPQEFTPERVRGRTVVMTTTNGTRAILAALPARRTYVAAMTNIGATACALAAGENGDVVLVASGTEGRISWEDTFCAGAVTERLADITGVSAWHRTDSAMIALALWRSVKGDVAGALRLGRGGRNVARLGLDAAFGPCAAVDSIDFAARVRREPLEVVAEHPLA